LSARIVPRSYKEDNWGSHISSLREAVKKRVSWKGAAVQDLRAEAEESPLLETVTRERLVNAQQTEQS
jgi:hypothetical protein